MQAMMLTMSSFHYNSSYKLPNSEISVSSHPKFKSNSRKGSMLIPPKCIPGETQETKKPVSPSRELGISTNGWCAWLGGLGFVETSYLTYLKLSNSEPFCPIGDGSCTDVLNSDYAVVLGVPLPLIGMTAYGLVFLLGLNLGGWQLPVKINQTDGRLLLLSITGSMAVASAYFLYILGITFGVSACPYCLGSAILSFSLFFITLKDFGLQELQKSAALPLFTAAIVLSVLSTSYSSVPPTAPRSEAVEFPYYATEITTESTPMAVSLAKHLRSIGAKMYGAFWCTHCHEQKEMFGREAANLLEYVECFPDGFRKGTLMSPACANIRIEGFPTWVINDEVLGGEKTIEELAEISGFEGNVVSEPK